MFCLLYFLNLGVICPIAVEKKRYRQLENPLINRETFRDRFSKEEIKKMFILKKIVKFYKTKSIDCLSLESFNIYSTKVIIIYDLNNLSFYCTCHFLSFTLFFL